MVVTWNLWVVVTLVILMLLASIFDSQKKSNFNPNSKDSCGYFRYSYIILVFEIFILIFLSYIDKKDVHKFILPPSIENTGGVQVLKSLTGMTAVIIFPLCIIFISLLKKLQLLPAIFFTWPIFLSVISIDYIGCDYYIKEYKRSCEIGAAGYKDGLWYIVVVFFVMFVVIRLQYNGIASAKKENT